MYFQKVLKGIKDLSPQDATAMVKDEGIRCNWWRREGSISASDISEQLTDNNVLCHLNHYNDPLPATHAQYSASEKLTYGDITSFISTTAGAVQRFSSAGLNICFPAFMTALQFATANFTTRGFIFYAYLITLGKNAIPLMQFAEEVRELQLYHHYLPYHREGEIVAKIVIPSPQIQKAEEYDGPAAIRDLRMGKLPTPLQTIHNVSYAAPDKYSNIREIL
jgi:hypothetical protein